MEKSRIVVIGIDRYVPELHHIYFIIGSYVTAAPHGITAQFPLQKGIELTFVFIVNEYLVRSVGVDITLAVLKDSQDIAVS